MGTLVSYEENKVLTYHFKLFYLNEEDDEGYEEAAGDPDVNKLEVGCFRDGLIDALVHGVHDQHHRQGQPDPHILGVQC